MSKINTNEPIDFVILWVDGADPEWLAEKRKYEADDEKGDTTEVRFRSWDNLQYWFRGVEKFAPWVRKIHFVTWGHLPPWLDTTNPKLNIVNHKDYIPAEYLPTFNANTIELNLHRIDDLAEQFVYFNDDMFVTAPVTPDDFFRNGKPRDAFGLNCIYFGKKSAGFFNGNDLELINIHFDKDECMKKHKRKWFSLKNGWKCVARTLLLAFAWHWFPGFYYDHLPTDFLKSTYKKVWELEGDTLDATCREKFRSKTNCNQWLMKFWQLAEGNFEIRNRDFGKCFHIKDRTFPSALDAIRKGKYPLICLNDTIYTSDFEKQKQEALEAFDVLLPEKSSFEK